MRYRLALCATGLVLSACGTAPSGSWDAVRAADGTAYSLMVPAGETKGLVLLLGLPDHALLPRLLAARGLASVAPVVDLESMYLNIPSLERLEAVLADARSRTHAPAPGRVAVGGVSLGGTGAVRYAQRCALERCDAALAPSALFAVDAPLDMERLWRSSTAVLRRGWEGSNLRETQWIVDHLVSNLRGPPQDYPALYAARSPFSYFAADGGNARFLLEMPIRLYTEPDIEYWVTERRLDFYNVNAFDAAGMVNRLLLGGNDAAELIATSGKGVRPDGSRNPHSWSIVDELDLTRWLVEKLGIE